MARSSLIPQQPTSIMHGLLSTTALTLLISITVPGMARADDLTFDEPGNGSPSNQLEWDQDNSNWTNTTTGTPNSDFDDGDAVTFDDFGRTVTITETVAPGSVLFTESINSVDRIESDNGASLSTDSALGGVLTIDLDEADGNLLINADITGGNGVNFNSIATNPGIITMNGNVAPSIQVSGGTFVLTGDAASNATLTAGDFELRNTGSVTGTTSVSGGIFTNAGNTADGGGLLGPVNVSGVSATDFGTLNNLSTGTISGTTTVDGFGDLNNSGVVADLNVQGGTFDNLDSGDVTGAVDMTGGQLNNSGDIGTPAASGPVTITGGTLTNNADGSVRGPVTIGSNTVGGAAGIVNGNGGTFSSVNVQTGGTMNVNEATTGIVTVTGGTVVVAPAGVDPVADPAGSLSSLVTVSDGLLSNGGDLNGGALVNGPSNAVSGTLNNLSTGTISGTTTVDGFGDLNNSGVVADLNVQGGTFDNLDSGDVTGAVDMTGGQLNNSGDIGTPAASGPVTITGGTLTNNADGSVRGPVTIGSNTVGGAAGIVNGNGGTFSSVNVQTGGTMNVNEATTGIVTVTGGTVVVAPAGVDPVADPAGSLSSLVTVSDGLLSNGGDLNGGALVNGPSNAVSGTLNNLSTGTISGTTTVDGFGDLNNSGVVADLNVQGGTFDNLSSGDVIGAIDLTGGQLNNSGDLGTLAASGSVTVSGGTLTNNASGTILQTVDLSGAGTVNINGGAFTGGIANNGGTVNVNTTFTGNLTNTSGTLNINTAYTGALTNNGSTIRINGLDNGVDPAPTQTGSLVGPGTINNISGSIETFAGGTVAGLVTLGGGDLTSAGGTYTTGVNVTGGSALITGDTAMGQLNTSAGSTTIQNGATLTPTTTVLNSGTGMTTNSGIIDGAVTVQAGTFAQTGTGANVTGLVQAETGGTVNASGGSFDTEVRAVGGNVTITGPVMGDIRNTGTGEISVASGGTLAGTMNADTGTFSVAGTLENGALNVAGASGVVTGIIEATAPVTVTGGTLITRGPTADIRSATTVTNATVQAEGGAFTGGATLNTGAEMQVLGSVGGTITNAAGSVTVGTDGDITGVLNQNANTTLVNGAISGTANVNGGTLTSANGSQFGQAVNVDGGTLAANAGTFSGGVDAVTGTVNVTGAVTGDMRNAGGTVTVASTGNLTGTLTTTAGMTTNNGTIDALNANGGTTTQAAGTVEGLATARGGTLIAAGGAFDGGLTAIAGGDVDVTGAISANSFSNDGGLIDITGTGALTGALTHNSGTTTVDGTVGSLSVAGSGITTQSGANITGPSTVTTNGVLVTQGGTFAAPITNTGGRIDVTGPTSAEITNQSGLLIVHADETLTGSATNAGNMLLHGTVAGTVNNTDGTLTVSPGQSAAVTAGLTNADGATVALNGTLTADVTNDAGGIFNVDGGALVGGFDNFGEMTTTGTNTVSGASSNAGELTVQTGSLTINNRFENASGNTTTINTGTTLTAAEIINTQTGRIVNSGTLSGPLTNNGLVEATNGMITGLVTNNGTITGASQFAGGLVNNGTVDLTGNATVGDVVTIGGSSGLSGNGTFALDIDLSGDSGGLGTSDYILADAGAPVTGTINLAFNVVGTGGEPVTGIPVILVDDAAANNFTYTSTGLPDPGETIIYSLSQNGSNGDVFVSDLLNPGIGALAGSIVLTQSLIGSVINRPSSPYVNGLAYQDENPCGAGGWARLTGGSADSNGQITQEGDDARTLRGEISADFYGLQIGGDFACFNGHFNGWDLAGGGIAGFNEGRSNQPVFALEPNGDLSDRITSVTDVDFRQTYAGLYGTAVRDRFAMELQYRVENTGFTANNSGRNGSTGLGLNNSEFDSDSSTFSGSASYIYSIPDTELSFVPVAGFAYTQVSTDPILFEDGSVVQVEDFTSQVGFVGGTLSRTKFGEDGTTALNQFLTATYYNDFAANPRSTYLDADDGQQRSITTENLGDYTEISAGLNYVKILDVGNGLNAKQLSASVRGDIRVSDQLESWGLTAQMRVQF